MLVIEENEPHTEELQVEVSQQEEPQPDEVKAPESQPEELVRPEPQPEKSNEEKPQLEETKPMEPQSEEMKVEELEHDEPKPSSRPPRTKVYSVDPSEPVDLLIGDTELTAAEPITLGQMFKSTRDKYPDYPALQYKEEEGGKYRPVTYSQYYDICVRVAKSFLKVSDNGVLKLSIAISSLLWRYHLAWYVCFLAILMYIAFYSQIRNRVFFCNVKGIVNCKCGFVCTRERFLSYIEIIANQMFCSVYH